MEQNYEISKYAVFKDEAVEQVYFERELKLSVSYLKYVILFFGVLSFCVAVADSFLTPNHLLLTRIFTLKGIVLLLSVALFFLLDKIQDNVWTAVLLSFYEIAATTAYFLTPSFNSARTFQAQCMVVIILLLAFFLIPNRWMNLTVVSVYAMAFFLIFSFFFAKVDSQRSFLEGGVYLAIVTGFSCVSAYRIQYYKRRQYAVQLQLEQLTVKDSLTNIYNRMKFDQSLEEWMRLFNRYHVRFSIIMFDLDDFKAVNDTHGHMVGDQLLIAVCRVIKENIRAEDIFARWGGEEFTILLPYTPLKSAYDLAERIRKKTDRELFAEDLHITCSFGVTEFKQGDTAETFLNRADALMYEAKRSGKNKVMMAL